MKKLISVLAAIALSLSAVSSAQAAQWDTPDLNTVPKGASYVTVHEDGHLNTVSLRQVSRQANGAWDAYLCPDGPTTGNCSPSKTSWTFESMSMLEPCVSESQENCISSFLFIDSTGKEITPVQYGLAGGPRYDAIEKLGLYASGQTSLWHAPGLTNGGGTDTYTLSVATHQEYDFKTHKYVAKTMNVQVKPFTTLTGQQYKAPEVSEGKWTNGHNTVMISGADCDAWSNNGECGVTEYFPEGVTIRVGVRVSDEIAGWFSGRIENPQISVAKFSDSNSLVTVEAKPVLVPRFAVLATKENTNATAYKMLYGKGGTGKELFEGYSLRGNRNGEGSLPFTLLEQYRKVVNDSAAGVSEYWNFGSINTDGNNQCLKSNNRLLGIVSTNANVYDGGVPNFSGGALSYQVAGLHYAPNGTDLNLGTYDLVMRSDTARCLYGFSKAPLSATVSVVNEKGSKTTATTVVSEKNGWLKMAAYGFTFSKKTIKVKITKKKK